MSKKTSNKKALKEFELTIQVIPPKLKIKIVFK